MLSIFAISMALLCQAADVPLKKGKKISGKIVETIPAKVKIKIESGTVIEINLDQIEHKYLLSLPDSVSKTYKRIEILKNHISTLEEFLRVATNTYEECKGIAVTLSDQNEKLIEYINKIKADADQTSQSLLPKYIKVSPSDISWRVTQKTSGITIYSWRIKTNISNAGDYDIEMSIYDKDGFVVAPHLESRNHLSSGRQIIAGTGMVPDKVYARFNSAKALIEPDR
jgi:hypothetical protein